jgi:predicted thioesterase
MRELPDTLTGTHRHQVTEADAATRWRNDLPVLATPVLLWLGELAAMQALGSYLQDDEMTVGLSHDASHLAATPVGEQVFVTAVLVQQRGNRLVFEVSAHDGVEEVLRGTHTRAVVSRSKFLARLAEKAGKQPQPVSG